jgi:hypothetical protein
MSSFEANTTETPNVFPMVSLVEVFRFDEMMQNVMMDIPDRKVLICAGGNFQPQQQAARSFLMACHLIMSGRFGFEEALLTLQPPGEHVCRHFRVFKDSLRAISCARCLNWIDFSTQSTKDCFKHDCIEMQEYIHYSRYDAILAIFTK